MNKSIAIFALIALTTLVQAQRPVTLKCCLNSRNEINVRLNSCGGRRARILAEEPERLLQAPVVRVPAYCARRVSRRELAADNRKTQAVQAPFCSNYRRLQTKGNRKTQAVQAMYRCPKASVLGYNYRCYGNSARAQC